LWNNEGPLPWSWRGRKERAAPAGIKDGKIESNPNRLIRKSNHLREISGVGNRVPLPENTKKHNIINKLSCHPSMIYPFGTGSADKQTERTYRI